MQVGDKPENNFYVGDAIEQIINLNYEARGKQLRPKNPHFLNLKLCFVGYAFAGKRLQAMQLKEDYGLDSFTLSDLVEEALKFYQEHPDAIVKVIEDQPIKESLHEDSKEDNKAAEQQQQEAPEEAAADAEAEKAAEEPKTPVLRENPLFAKSALGFQAADVEVQSEASEIEEELNPEEDFRRCGEKMQACLFDGEEIPDQLYVDLFVAKLRMTYEYKDRAALSAGVTVDAKRELELTRAVANLSEELSQMRDPNSTVKKKKSRTEDNVEREIQDAKAELEAIR